MFVHTNFEGFYMKEQSVFNCRVSKDLYFNFVKSCQDDGLTPSQEVRNFMLETVLKKNKGKSFIEDIKSKNLL